MTLSAKLFLITFLFVALVIVGIYLVNQGMFKQGGTPPTVGMIPTTTPIQSDNPMGFPVDPNTGTIILPTEKQFSPYGVSSATGGGRLTSSTTCGQLQNIINCYLQKAPKLAVGYETFAQKDLYVNDPPAVQTAKCDETIRKLAETTRHESINAGCIW
ncbi:MAG: hypothetical protein WCO78_01030 [Candidatus Roizmanbacteria bacterium]